MATRTQLWLLLLIAGSLPGCAGDANSNSGATGNAKPDVAFVTNGVSTFWVIAEAGVKKGAEEFDANATVLMPVEGITQQKQMIEDMLTKGMDGIAVSPIDPVNQNELLNKAAQRTKLITHDSDAPDSDRLCYIGVDNYSAGRLCGAMVREALPNGGKVAIFIGRLEQDNSRRRRQGTIDAILDRTPDPTRFDPPGEVIEENGFTIVGTYTDQFDRAQGKANAEDVLSRHPDVAAMVGLFAYNPPLILEALSQGNKLGEVKVIAFDEDNETLQGIIDGNVVGTIVQNPYEYGRQSVRILAGLCNGQTLGELDVPESGFIDIPARAIRKDNVESFWEELKNNVGEK